MATLPLQMKKIKSRCETQADFYHTRNLRNLGKFGYLCIIDLNASWIQTLFSDFRNPCVVCRGADDLLCQV